MNRNTKTRTTGNTGRAPRSRRGVALMVVLGLLSMFVLVTITFVMTSTAHREAADSAKHLEVYGDPPDAMLHRAIYEVVRGSRNPLSRIGPHSLLEDMYGNREAVMGAVVMLPESSFPTADVANDLQSQVQRRVQGQFLNLTIVSFGPDKQPGVAFVDDDGNGVADDLSDLKDISPSNLRGDDRFLGTGTVTFDNVEGYYAGRVLTFLDGPAKNESVRIVRYFSPNPGAAPDPALPWRLLVTRPKNGQPVIDNLTRPSPVRVVINGRQFNGAGFGFARHSVSNRNGLLDLTEEVLDAPNLVDNSSSLPYSTPTDLRKWPFAFTPNPSEAAYQRFLADSPTGGAPVMNPFGVDADEDYDAPDYQNMMLAGAIWSRERGVGQSWVVRIPSLHRPDLVAFHLKGLGLDPSLIFNRNDTSWAGLLRGGLPSDASSLGQRMRQRLMLRPDPQDHVADATKVWVPGDAEWSGNPFFHPVLGPWDVDNDNDGVPDSIWVDLGAPVQVNESGKAYKPLFAILCLDLDGRFNLNVHGNWTHYSAREYINPTAWDGDEYGKYVYAGTNGQSSIPSYDLAPPSIRLKDQNAMDYYILGNRTVGRSYNGRRPSILSLQDNRLPTRLHYWGYDDVAYDSFAGGPYAGSAGTPYANSYNATFAGNANIVPAIATASFAPQTEWTTAGQGFSVAEVNLGGVLELGGLTNPISILRKPPGYVEPQSYPLNPYRLLLEGTAAVVPTGQGLTDGVASFLNRVGEGRYGERGTLFAQVAGQPWDVNAHPYGGRFVDVGAFFGLMPTSMARTPGFARPGLTFVDDNSTPNGSLGSGAKSYANHLVWPPGTFGGYNSRDPLFTPGGGAEFHVANLMSAHVLPTHDDFAPLAARGNRWSEGSYTFWSPGNLDSNRIALMGVGNYGFHFDPNGHMSLGLDFRGIPYAGRRAIQYPRGLRTPSYVGYRGVPGQFSTMDSESVSDVFGSYPSVPWRYGHKWYMTNETVDDPWEIDVYTVPRETRAYALNSSLTEVPLNPLNRSNTAWQVATSVTRRYPRGFPPQISATVNPADDFPKAPQVDQQATFYVDRPFTLGEMEPMLRRHDPDMRNTANRLSAVMSESELGSGSIGVPLRRWLTTTDSWDVPVPNISAPPEIAFALDHLSTLPEYANRRDFTTNLSFVDLVLGKIMAAKQFHDPDESPTSNDGKKASSPPLFPRPNEYSLTSNAVTTARRLTNAAASLDYATRFVPRDFFIGTRYDINRPFGNGIDDDFDGVVDEPPPPGPGLNHRIGPISNYPANQGFAKSTGHFQPFAPDQSSVQPVEPSRIAGELNVMYTDQGRTNAQRKSSLDTGTATGAGVAMEATNYVVGNPYPVKQPLARYDGNRWNGNPGAVEMSRQEMAKHLYILAMLFNEVSWQFPFGGSGPDPAGVLGAGDLLLTGSAPAEGEELRRRLAAYRCAQWAVNCVDFRDRDAIMTPFEFDINPFFDDMPGRDPSSDPPGDGVDSTWNVNGFLECPNLSDGSPHPNNTAFLGLGLGVTPNYQMIVEPGVERSSGRMMDSAGPVEEAHRKLRDKVRGLVWGMESPELLITESMAMHNLRVADTDKEALIGNRSQRTKTTSTDPGADKTLDQVRVPQGSLFVELYAAGNRHAQPSPYHPDLAQLPTELYDIVSHDARRPEHQAPGSLSTGGSYYARSARFGLLDLSRLAPPTEYQGAKYRLPVWRLALSKWHIPHPSEPNNPSSIQSMLYDSSSGRFRPYTCSLAPFESFSRDPETEANAEVNMNWISMGPSPDRKLRDFVSVNRFAPWIPEQGTNNNVRGNNAIELDRFVWFVDRNALDSAPPSNVFCFWQSAEGVASTEPPLRFLLEPGHYAVVGPERLDSKFTGAVRRDNFVTIMAQSAYHKPPDASGVAPGNDEPKAIGGSRAWYPSWFDLSVQLQQVTSNVGDSNLPTLTKVPAPGSGDESSAKGPLPTGPLYAAGDLVNYIRGGPFDGGTGGNQPGVLGFAYPAMVSPHEVWHASMDENYSLTAAEIKTPVSIPVALKNYSNNAFISAIQPYSGLNISEPLGGYGYAVDQNQTTDADLDTSSDNGPLGVPQRLVNSLDNKRIVVQHHDGFAPEHYPDRPWDGVPNTGAGGSELLNVENKHNLVMPGMYEDVRTVFLQRLANPLCSWHPVFNPYITVDWMPIDLTVYNGQTVWQEKWADSSGTPTVEQSIASQSLLVDDTYMSLITDVQTPPATTRNVPPASRQRGPQPGSWASPNTGSTKTDELPLWPAMSAPPYKGGSTWEQNIGAASTAPAGTYRHDPVCSLGYLNYFFKKTSTTRPLDAENYSLAKRPLTTVELKQLGGVGSIPTVPRLAWIDYIGAPPRPFPWLTWFDRPFASHLELMLVPASSPSRFTLEFTYQTTANRRVPPRLAKSTPKESNVDFAQPQFFGLRTQRNMADATGVDPNSLRWQFGHLLNFFDSSGPSDPGDPGYPDAPATDPDSTNRTLARSNFYRMLEYVHVPTRFSGADEFVVPYDNIAVGSNTYDPANPLFSPPFNRVPKFREPGRVNLNTFMGAGMTRHHPTSVLAENADTRRINQIAAVGRDASQQISAAQHWGALVNFTPQHARHWELFNYTRYAGDLYSWTPYDVNPTIGASLAETTTAPRRDNRWYFSINGVAKTQLFDPDRPSLYSNPIRSYTNSLRFPLAQQKQRKRIPAVDGAALPALHRYADSSLLKWDDTGAPFLTDRENDASNEEFGKYNERSPLAEGMLVSDPLRELSARWFRETPDSSFNSVTGKQEFNFQHIQDSRRNPYFRYQDYIKMGSVATTHSNVYAAWITMGKFEVERVQTTSNNQPNFRHPNVVGHSNPDGYRLVRELGSDLGTTKRHRAFIIVDRSIPVGFQRGENFNVDDAIRVRRIIE